MRRQVAAWAIAYCQGKYVGLYQGFWYTRGKAIQSHREGLGKTWKQCRADGDRCVKVVLHYELPKEGR